MPLLRIALIVCLCFTSVASAQKEFGFDNRKPSGQPYMTPDESVKKFKTSPGFEVKLFAGEPDVINPVAFTIDEKGRLWVLENFEYPKRTPKGQKPRDRIKILEDTDGDGKCDKVTIWADGKDLPIGWDLATGIEVGNGGVYLGAAPYLFFLQDTDGDGKCDKQKILLKGFGSEDTHETLNTFQWGPDSKLYGLHGVFTHSKIDGVQMNAAVWRYDPPTNRFEIFAEGTSNPWGMDFDSYGQCHLVCCVIPHLFHMVPGGTYIRQAGISFNPYAFGLLKQSCDHTHHKESGWAHAGLLVLEGDHVPKAYQGSIIMGSIHGCSIKRDTLHHRGSTYVASHAPDLVVSGDKNFRPINLRWGPDGSIYVIDWHDQNPCHQALPDSWDKERGRIFRIQPKGHKVTLPGDLSKKTSKELVELLKNDNPWWYRTALQLLNERNDKSVVGDLEKMAFTFKSDRQALRGLWGLYAIGGFKDEIAERALQHKSEWMRSWAIRFLGESGEVSEKMLSRLTEMAKSEAAPEVRLQLASTAQRLKKQNVLPLLQNLMLHKKDVSDPFIPLMIWLAYEPRVKSTQAPVLDWLKENAPGNPLITTEIVPKTMRRLVATGKKEDLEACIAFLGQVIHSEVRSHALEGLVTALKNQKLKAPESWSKVFPALVKDSDGKVQDLARKLAVHFQDPKAIQQAVDIAQNELLKSDVRINALRDLSLADFPEVEKSLLEIVKAKFDKAEVRTEAIRSLSHFQGEGIGEALLINWSNFTPAMKSEAVNLLTSRKTWATALLKAVGQKKVAPGELNNNHILKITAFKDAKLNQQIEKVWGNLRDTPAELLKLIAKMHGELDTGKGSFVKGKKVFENNCAKCHKFEGTGHDVGPELDGAARDIDYLLGNILDPNRVVGQPYYTRLVQLKNGQIETGLLHAEDPQSITLKVENNNLKVIQKKDIDGEILVQPKSVMPEGLDKNLTIQDFRDLVRYVMADPFLTDVSVTGPIAAKKNPDDKEGFITLLPGAHAWTPLAVPVTGKISLPAPKGKGHSVYYLSAKIRSPKDLTTELRLGSNQYLRVWLNNKLIYKGSSGKKQAEPDQISVPVKILSEKIGIVEIELLIEVHCEGEPPIVYARFTDRDRNLIYSDFGKGTKDK